MDKWLVLQWNGGLGWGYPADYVIWALAEFGVVLLLLLLLIRWFSPGTGRRRERRMVLLACAGAVFALGFSVILTQFWPRERPYRTMDAFKLLAGMHSPSFPSDHGAMVFTLAWIMGYRSRLWSWLTWPLSLAIAFARVAAGVHYPSDMLGSFVIAAGVGWLLLWLRPSLAPALDQLVNVLTPGGARRVERQSPIEPWVPPEDAWPPPGDEREWT